MTSITIDGLEEPLEAQLRLQASSHGRSIEDEVRHILHDALNWSPSPPSDLASAIRARFLPLGGFDLPDVPRDPMRDPPSFGG